MLVRASSRRVATPPNVQCYAGTLCTVELQQPVAIAHTVVNSFQPWVIAYKLSGIISSALETSWTDKERTTVSRSGGYTRPPFFIN